MSGPVAHEDPPLFRRTHGRALLRSAPTLKMTSGNQRDTSLWHLSTVAEVISRFSGEVRSTRRRRTSLDLTGTARTTTISSQPETSVARSIRFDNRVRSEMRRCEMEAAPVGPRRRESRPQGRILPDVFVVNIPSQINSTRRAVGAPLDCGIRSGNTFLTDVIPLASSRRTVRRQPRPSIAAANQRFALDLARIADAHFRNSWLSCCLPRSR